MTAPKQPDVFALFQRSLTAHLPPDVFARLQKTRILVAGLGGGSNIAELLVRKGFARLILADPDCYELHNIRQRGSLISTQGQSKVAVMAKRLRDINPQVALEEIPDGVDAGNVSALVAASDIVVDMIDFYGLPAKVALYRAARSQGRVVVTAPSAVNGAMLFIFSPDGIPFESFFGYEEGLSQTELSLRLLDRLIAHYPEEAPRALYLDAARGERTLPLDAVGVDQAAVLAVAAIENLALGRMSRLVTIPRCIHIDVSDPVFLARIIDYSSDFADT